MNNTDDANIYKLYAESYDSYDPHDPVAKLLRRIKNVDGKKIIQGNVDLSNLLIDELPLAGVHVTGNFNCSFNDLQSLSGAPVYVGGNFLCVGCHIESFDNVSTEVGLAFLFTAPTTIKQIASTNIQSKHFIFKKQDVTKEVERAREQIKYDRTLTSELSGVEDAINIGDIDF